MVCDSPLASARDMPEALLMHHLAVNYHSVNYPRFCSDKCQIVSEIENDTIRLYKSQETSKALGILRHLLSRVEGTEIPASRHNFLEVFDQES